MSDIDREVAAAMADMSAEDLAEISGGSAPPARADLAPGADATGTVLGVSGEDVFLEFGEKIQGVVPRHQFGKKEPVEVGRRVDIVVERYDPENSLYICSRKGALQRATWTNLSAGMMVEGRVTGMNKGGLEVDLKGLRAFMPASHSDIGHMKDISVLIGENIQCEVLEVDRRHKNILVSRRKAQEKELAEAAAKLMEELTEGQVRRGIVGNVTDFGAFVNLGGVDGLIHISDLSWKSVRKVTDVVNPGQSVEVKVLKIDRERGRVSLGLKHVTPDPWVGIEDRYPAGTPLKARVVRLADFGAFAELEEGVDGLIPISEMSWGRIGRPAEVVSVGDLVDAVVIRVEADKRRIALSLKQATPDPWAEVISSFEKGSLATGKVTRVAEFGAFVELAPGVEGLIHISELSDKRVHACSDVVQEGQQVEARVLDVDAPKRRIALSIRALADVSPASPREGGHRPAPAPTKGAQKRKKTLRGGLATDWSW